MKVKITIVSTYEVEMDEFNDTIQKHITDNYEAASLPDEYQDDAEYLEGSVTYEASEEDN
jgi:hypothetical protein